MPKESFTSFDLRNSVRISIGFLRKIYVNMIHAIFHGAFIIGSPELELIPLELIGYYFFTCGKLNIGSIIIFEVCLLNIHVLSSRGKIFLRENGKE